MMKLCKDCRWCSDPDDKYPRCLHAKATKDDPIHGNHDHFYCVAERSVGFPIGCGPRGRNFEPRDTSTPIPPPIDLKPKSPWQRLLEWLK